MADKISVLALFQARAQSWLSPAEIKLGMPEVPDRTLRNYLSDVASELKHLDLSRIGGLGITRQEFEAWQQSRSRVAH